MIGGTIYFSMEWKDPGDISNANSLPRLAVRDPSYRYTSLSMSVGIITG